MMNAPTAVATAGSSNSRRPNSTPAKTSRFFVHWPGRSVMSRFRTEVRRSAPLADAPATARLPTEEEVVRAIRTGSAARGARGGVVLRGDELDLGGSRKTPDRVVLGFERLEHGQ